VRLRFVVTHWSPDKYNDFIAGIEGVVDELRVPQLLPPGAAIDYMFEPDVLVEAFAVLD
jgi:hypothetical protein